MLRDIKFEKQFINSSLKLKEQEENGMTQANDVLTIDPQMEEYFNLEDIDLDDFDGGLQEAMEEAETKKVPKVVSSRRREQGRNEGSGEHPPPQRNEA